MGSKSESQSDVLLSVWNRFFSGEQAAGFAANGLKVSWVGTGRAPSGVSKRHRAWISTALLRLHFKTGYVFLQNLSRIAFERKSRRFANSARLVWAYMEYNNGLLAKCREQNIPTVLDIPIGHQRLCQEVLAREHGAYGIPYGDESLDYWTRVYEQAYDMADRLVVGSSFVKQTLTDRGVDPAKIVVNPYGVDTDFWNESFRGRPSATDDKLVFVYAASIGLRKGVQYLLRAWRKAELDDCELLICGANYLPRHPDFMEVPPNVRFIGPQTHEQLREIYKQAHVYVLPSLFEGLARSGLEAMASGLAPIVTWETGLTDMVTNGVNGWIVPSRDEDSLASCLQSCAKNPRAVANAGRKAHEIAMHYSWENYGRRCATLVREVLTQTDAGRKANATNKGSIKREPS